MISVSKTEVDCRATSLGGSDIQVPVDVLAWVPIPEVEALVASQGGSSIQGPLLQAEVVSRKWFRLSSKCFRFCSIIQNSVLHDVHSIETAMANDDLLVLLYLSGIMRNGALWECLFQRR